jgi:uncharacterized protein YggL (DUF469 family)
LLTVIVQRLKKQTSHLKAQTFAACFAFRPPRPVSRFHPTTIHVRQSPRMKRRIRKKKHLGEFRQFGFSLACRFHASVSPEQFDRFVDEFIIEAIEAGGLAFGGGGDPARKWSGIVCRAHRYDSITEKEQERVRDWLRGQEILAAVEISKPWDVWHGSDPLDEPAAPEQKRRTGQHAPVTV